MLLIICLALFQSRPPLPTLLVITQLHRPERYRNLLGNTTIRACLSNGNQQSHVELRLFPLAGAMLLIICLSIFQSRVITQLHRPRKIPKLARQHNRRCLSVQRQSAISCGTSSLSSALSQIGWSDASHPLPWTLPITTPNATATSNVPKLPWQHNHPCLSVQRQSAISCGTSSLSSALSQIGWSDASHPLPWTLPITTPNATATSNVPKLPWQHNHPCLSVQRQSAISCGTSSLSSALSQIGWSDASHHLPLFQSRPPFSTLPVITQLHRPRKVPKLARQHNHPCLSVQRQSAISCGTSSLSSALSQIGWSDASHHSPLFQSRPPFSTLPVITQLHRPRKVPKLARQHNHPCLSVQRQSAISCGISSLSSALSQIGWSDASHHLPFNLPITTPFLNATSHYTATSPQYRTKTCLATQPSVLVCPTAISNLMWNFVSFLSTVSDWLERCFSSFALHSSNHDPLSQRYQSLHSYIAPERYRNLLGNTTIRACLSNGNQQSHVEFRLFPQHCLRLAGAMLLIICLGLFRSRPPFPMLAIIHSCIAQQRTEICLATHRIIASLCDSSLSSAPSQIFGAMLLIRKGAQKCPTE